MFPLWQALVTCRHGVLHDSRLANIKNLKVSRGQRAYENNPWLVASISNNATALRKNAKFPKLDEGCFCFYSGAHVLQEEANEEVHKFSEHFTAPKRTEHPWKLTDCLPFLVFILQPWCKAKGRAQTVAQQMVAPFLHQPTLQLQAAKTCLSQIWFGCWSLPGCYDTKEFAVQGNIIKSACGL